MATAPATVTTSVLVAATVAEPVAPVARTLPNTDALLIVNASVPLALRLRSPSAVPFRSIVLAPMFSVLAAPCVTSVANTLLLKVSVSPAPLAVIVFR